jgi:hypothetical protein
MPKAHCQFCYLMGCSKCYSLPYMAFKWGEVYVQPVDAWNSWNTQRLQAVLPLHFQKQLQNSVFMDEWLVTKQVKFQYGENCSVHILTIQSVSYQTKNDYEWWSAKNAEMATAHLKALSLCDSVSDTRWWEHEPLLSCNTMQSCRWTPMFQRNISPPISWSKIRWPRNQGTSIWPW